VDDHKNSVVACVRQAAGGGSGGEVAEVVRSFGTMTADLLALSDWLAAAGVTHAAMEKIGDY